MGILNLQRLTMNWAVMSKYNSHPTLSPISSKHNWSGFLQRKKFWKFRPGKIQTWCFSLASNFSFVCCNTWLFLCICAQGLPDCWHCGLPGCQSWDSEDQAGHVWNLTCPSLPCLAPGCSLSLSLKCPEFCLSHPYSTVTQVQNLRVTPANLLFLLKSSLLPVCSSPLL